MNGNDRITPLRSSVLAKYTSGRTRSAEPGGAYDLVEPGAAPMPVDTADGDQVRHHLCYSEHTISPDALRLFLRNGDRLGYWYHFMERTFLSGSGKLVLYHTTGKVIVEGANLDQVEPIILQRRIGYLKETDGRFTDGDASEQTLITRITVDVQED